MAAITRRDEIVLSKPKEMQDFLMKSQTALAMAMPKHLNVERQVRLALTCFSTTPKLRQCTAQSILASVMLASQVGLEVGVAGQGYLVPYGKTCTFVPGWQGLVGLLNNTGRATAWTGAVFEGDEWEFELGSNPKCRHVPGENFGDPDKLVWVYACGKVNGSEQPIVEAWPINRVWKHRDRYNKVGERHYSYEQPEMYARKVVLLQVLKYLPKSISVENAIALANASDEGRMVKIEDGVTIDIGEAGEETPKLTDKEAAGRLAESSRSRKQPDKEKEEVATADVVQSDPEDEGRELYNDLKDILSEAGVKELTFEKACREQKLLTPASTLVTSSAAKLRLIIENAGSVLATIEP